MFQNNFPEISLNQIPQVAKLTALRLTGGEVIALIGQLGSGKTTFTKYLGKELGVKQSITSPTFVLMQQYLTGKKNSQNQYITMLHLDIYRMKDFSEVKSLGITDFWQKPQTVTVIEWADKIIKELPKNSIILKFNGQI